MSALRLSKRSSKRFPKTLVSSLLLCSGLFLSVPAIADVPFGPVQKMDTLSKIVNRFYVGADRSTIRLMKNIVAKNPTAFINGDMNLLKLNAQLVLPGNDWLVNEPRFRGPNATIDETALLIADLSSGLDKFINRSPTEMQQHITFLEAERASLMAQVEALQLETQRLNKKLQTLEVESKKSDERLLALDKEITRLTELLADKEVVASQLVDASELNTLQAKLDATQFEMERISDELSKTKTALSNNQFLQTEAQKTIAQLTQENQQLQHVLKQSQPGVHYFGDSSKDTSLSLFGGKFDVPLWMLVAGGSFLSLILVSLLGTRKPNNDSPEPEVVAGEAIDVDVDDYNALLETAPSEGERGFAQATNQPEENVFKMFDEGTLVMDLKLEMAESYLHVSDFEAAKSVLQEVIDGGSELQKRKAARLLKQAA